MPPKLGQHFLSNASVLERIAVATCPAGEDLVIEIGPGRGALTEKLLRRAARVVAIEIDAGLVAHLRTKFAGEPRLEIVHADILATDLARWGRAPIAGNLPYYITSPILEKAVRLDVPRIVFLMQKEVAERLVARPGCREYGYLTLQTALFAGTRLLFEVKPGSFRPPPQVDSAVVLLTPHTLELGVGSREAFLRFLGHCFGQKRKTLRNNLAGIYGKEAIDPWPEAGLRAEQIALEQFAAMFRRLPPVA
ncbi:MAG: 16S rRNA (adenine(1518)-N(6)/adenine(1519)-N(6))-dimethyltransferase RsmA [Candidatus Solibacter sp.]